jgi:hypothetical protein
MTADALLCECNNERCLIRKSCAPPPPARHNRIRAVITTFTTVAFTWLPQFATISQDTVIELIAAVRVRELLSRQPAVRGWRSPCHLEVHRTQEVPQ